MVRFILLIVLILVLGAIALYFVEAWRERNILRAREEEKDKDV